MSGERRGEWEWGKASKEARVRHSCARTRASALISGDCRGDGSGAGFHREASARHNCVRTGGAPLRRGGEGGGVKVRLEAGVGHDLIGRPGPGTAVCAGGGGGTRARGEVGVSNSWYGISR